MEFLWRNRAFREPSEASEEELATLGKLLAESSPSGRRIILKRLFNRLPWGSRAMDMILNQIPPEEVQNIQQELEKNGSNIQGQEAKSMSSAEHAEILERLFINR